MTISVAGDAPDWIGSKDASADTLIKTTSAVSVSQYTQIVTVGKSYRSVVITTQIQGYNGQNLVYLQCSDAASDLMFVSPSLYSRGSYNDELRQWVFPCPVSAGGQIKLTITPVSANAIFRSVIMVGSTDDLTGIGGPTRSDGWPYPLGQNAAHDESSASATLIAAPGAGRRIMLMSLFTTLPSGVISGEVIVQGIIGGTTIDLSVAAIVANADGVTAVAPVPPQGLLLDDDTAVSVINLSTAPQRTNAVYDLVS